MTCKGLELPIAFFNLPKRGPQFVRGGGASVKALPHDSQMRVSASFKRSSEDRTFQFKFGQPVLTD